MSSGNDPVCDMTAAVYSEFSRDEIAELQREVAQLTIERDRLRAVLGETPENRAVWFDVLREFLPEDEPEDQLAAAVGLVAALRAKAGIP